MSGQASSQRPKPRVFLVQGDGRGGRESSGRGGGCSQGLVPRDEQHPHGPRPCPGGAALFILVMLVSVGAQLTWQETQPAWRAGA